VSTAEQVMETDRARVRAMVTGNETALERYFTEDLTYAHTNGVLDSKATLIDKIRTGVYKYASIEVDDARVKELPGDAAIVTGTAGLGVRTDAGNLLRIPIRFISVYVRDEDAWKMTAWQSTRLPT